MGRGNTADKINLAIFVNLVENRLAQNIAVLGSKFRIGRRKPNVK